MPTNNSLSKGPERAVTLPPAQRIWLTDVAALLGMPYVTVWGHAQRGAFGEVGREGSRVYVARSGVEGFRIHSQKPVVQHPSGGAGSDDPDIADLVGAVNLYHVCGAQRTAVEDLMRAELLVAQSTGNAARAQKIADFLQYTTQATYERGPGGNWRLTLPGIGSQTTVPTQPFDPAGGHS